MPSAAGSIGAARRATATAWGKAPRSWRRRASDQPITPVELGSTWPAVRPSRRRGAAQRRSEVSTPPGAQTLEILLLIDHGPERGLARRLRPDDNRGAGKRILVNIAAKPASVRSSAISVSVHLRAGFGASRGTNSKRERPDAETRRQRGLRGEPRAMGFAVGEREVGAGHAEQVRFARRGVKKILHASRPELTNAGGAQFLMEMPGACALFASFFPS
jgi:hypothetical protein